jgi:hypothetical protein
MSPEEAHKALIARCEAAAGLRPGEAAFVRVNETSETMARRLMQGLLDHEEVDVVLTKVKAGAQTALLVAMDAGSVEGIEQALECVVAQMMTFGILLGKGRS